MPRTVVARPGASTISSLSGNDDSTNSQLDIADSVAVETIAALESGGEITLLDAVAMESDNKKTATEMKTMRR